MMVVYSDMYVRSHNSKDYKFWSQLVVMIWELSVALLAGYRELASERVNVFGESVDNLDQQ